MKNSLRAVSVAAIVACETVAFFLLGTAPQNLEMALRAVFFSYLLLSPGWVIARGLALYYLVTAELDSETHRKIYSWVCGVFWTLPLLWVVFAGLQKVPDLTFIDVLQWLGYLLIELVLYLCFKKIAISRKA